MLEHPRKKGEWTQAVAILATACTLAAGTALAADPPSASCRALLAQDRALVDIQLSRFIDPRLAKLIRLGLAGRIQLELVLYRQRPFWFDEAQERTTRETVLRYHPDPGGFLLDGDREVEDPLRLSLARIALRPVDGLEEGGLYQVEVKVSLRVVTPQSLGKVAAWLAGHGRQGEDDVSQTLLQAVAEDLARTAHARCQAVRR